MVSPVSTDAAPVAATDILLYRTLASARQEGLPEPTSTTVSGGVEPDVLLHLRGAEGWLEWQAWFTRHGADSWTLTEKRKRRGPYRYHYARAMWRDWRLSLVYLTPVELEAGVSGD